MGFQWDEPLVNDSLSGAVEVTPNKKKFTLNPNFPTINFSNLNRWIKESCFSIANSILTIRLTFRTTFPKYLANKVSRSVFKNFEKGDLFAKNYQHKRLVNTLDKLSSITLRKEKVELKDDLKNSSRSTFQNKLNWLSQHGYTTLVSRLKGKRRHPWEAITRLQSPILIEQLTELDHLLSLQKVKKGPSPIINYCLQLAEESMETIALGETDRVNEVATFIGKVIYLVDHHVDITKITEIDEMEISSQKIEALFQEHLNQHLNIVMKQHDRHIQSGIQPADIALNTYLPIEISRILLTESGTINIGIIDTLIQFFIKDYEHPLNYEINLISGLNLFYKSAQLREKFLKVAAPKQLHSPAAEIIRITLGLPSHVELTDIHAKLTVFSALLSHLRQTPTGSCFAESLAIELLSSRLGQCLEDFTNLIHEGKLTRTVNHLAVDFPFILKTDIQNLNEPIALDKPLWRSPGIISSCKTLGIDNPKKCLDLLLPKLKLYDNPTVEDLLKTLCEAANQTQEGVGDLFAKACFAFESRTMNPLLKIWRNVIAGMAEAEESGMLKSAILQAVTKTLNVRFLHLTPSQIKWKDELYQHLTHILRSKIQLLYDPTVIHYTKNQDFRTTEGGFVLYWRTNNEDAELKRIDTPELFQNILINCLRLAQSLMGKSFFNAKTNNMHASIVKHLEEYIREDLFLKKIVRAYYPENKNITTVNYDDLLFTPWITKSGNDAGKVIDVYFEKKLEHQTDKFIPDSASELLSKIIEMGSTIPEREKKLLNENPFVLIPLRTQHHHSFSLMLGHSSLKNAWMDENPSDWIQRFVITPGVAIAHANIDHEIREKLIQFCIDKLLIKGNEKKFKHAATELSGPMSYCYFREALLSFVHEFNQPSTLKNYNESKRLFDTELCQCLPNKFRQQFQDSVVYFADTNWSEGVHDIFYCFAVNPGTGKLEIWEAFDNGEHFEALDQNYWMLNRTWEFYSHPEEFLKKKHLQQ